MAAGFQEQPARTSVLCFFWAMLADAQLPVCSKTEKTITAGSGIPPAAVILYAVSMTLGLMFLTREPQRGKTEGTHCQRDLRGHPQLFGLGRNVAPAGVAHFSGELRRRPRLSCLTFSVRIVAVIHFGCPAPPAGPQYHLLSIHVVYYLSLAAGFRPPRPRLSGVS